MTLDQAEQGANILSQLNDHDMAATKIRSLHKKASDGDVEALDKLTNIALELNDKVISDLKSKLSLI